MDIFGNRHVPTNFAFGVTKSPSEQSIWHFWTQYSIINSSAKNIGHGLFWIASQRIKQPKFEERDPLFETQFHIIFYSHSVAKKKKNNLFGNQITSLKLFKKELIP